MRSVDRGAAGDTAPKAILFDVLMSSTMHVMQKPRITIVGAGISGLSLAYFLKQSLGEKIALSVYENRGEAGGTIGTLSENGYLEEKGPNGFFDNRPATLELIRSLGLEEKLIHADAHAENRFVYHAGRLRKIPAGPQQIFSTDLLSFGGKMRLFAEPFIAPRRSEDDETLEQFFTRRIGKEATERLTDPFVSGIYAGSLNQLSARATFPKLVEFEEKYGSVLKGFVRSKKQGPRKRPKLTSFREGLVTLVRKLADELRNELHLSSPVSSIEYRKENRTFLLRFDNGSVHETDSLVLAIPAFAAAKLVSKLDSELALVLAGILYSPVQIAALGFSENAFGTAPSGFGYLFSRQERKEILGCLFSSSIFPGCAPRGKVLLRVLLGGADHPEAAGFSDEKVLDLAVSNLKQVLDVHEKPEWARIFRYERAIPQYTIGHLEKLRKLDEILGRFPGFVLSGNAYRGIGINDCIEESKRLAGEINSGGRDLSRPYSSFVGI